MEHEVKDRSGQPAGSVELDDRVWGAAQNDGLLQQVVVAQLANRRQGTHETKTRAQVAYSTRKLRGQKHSGRSRIGSLKSPVLVGGGVAFGPHARSYRQRTPKKMRRQALRVALSDKQRESKLTVIDEFSVDAPRTKDVVNLIDALGLNGRTLLVVASHDRDIVLSVRGASRTNVIFADGLNATLVASSSNLVVTRDALVRIEELWGDVAKTAETVA